MTVFSWLIFIPILELAYVDSATENFYQFPEHTIEATVGVEAVALDTLYIKGGSVNYQQYIDVDRYAPFVATYKIEAGLKYKGFEVGYYHECTHGVESSVGPAPLNGGMTKYFLRYGGKL
jgi:hypothetical protein